MKVFFATIVALIGLLFLPVVASAASPEAVAAVQQAERTLTLQALWARVQENATQVKPTEDEAQALVTTARAAYTAIEAGDYKTADAALADLLDLAVAASKPKVRA